jgi:hypothetical protein
MYDSYAEMVITTVAPFKADTVSSAPILFPLAPRSAGVSVWQPPQSGGLMDQIFAN